MNTEPTAPVIPGYSHFTFVNSGSVFTIWRAREDAIEREVDVKLISPDAPGEIAGHALRMAKRFSAFSIDGLERIFTIEENAANPYFVTEAMAPKTLADLVEKNGPMSEDAILRIARRITCVLKTLSAKEPIVLRSLKPQNLHVDESGSVKITDFSLAIVANDPVDGPVVDGGNIIGTPQFLSPEQASGAMDVDFRSDMYALGLVLYFLGTGKNPFEDHDVYEIIELQQNGTLEDPRALNKGLSDGFARLLARMTMKKREDRYQDWDKLREDIERLQDGRSCLMELENGASSTIALTVPDRNENKKTESHPRKGPVVNKKTIAKAIAANPYGQDEANKVLKPSKYGQVKTLLWLLLVVWLGWLANCRMSNPLNLPEKFAPEIELPALDTLFEMILSPDASEKQAPAPVVRPVAPVPEPKPVPPATTEGTPMPVEPVPEDESKIAAVPGEPSQKPNAEPAPPKAPSWNGPVVACLRKGDLNGAKAAAMAVGNTEAGKIASFLGSIPDVDEVFVSILMKHKGKVVPIVYLGKERKISPLRREGDTLQTLFKMPDGSEKVVPIQLSKLTREEKFRWLQNAETDLEHAAVAIEALKAGDRGAAKIHVARSGILTPFLEAALK